METAQRIRESLSKALSEMGIALAPSAVPLEFPAELAHGDYASGIALAKAKEAGMNPRALAEKIVASVGSIEGVSKIQIAGPGFINIFLDGAHIIRTLKHAADSSSWGRSEALSGKSVLMEYTSPNLFKPLHIGNLVGNIIGESSSRLMQYAGAEVKRINYPSDIGLTVAKGVWGLRKNASDPRDIQALGEAYRDGNAAYDSDGVAKSEIEEINRKLYEGSDAELNRLRREGISTSHRHLEDICKKLGTEFDFELFESDAAPVGREIVLSREDVFPVSEGARIFEGSHTRVFLNSQGLPTYEAKDLGNFILKQNKFPRWDWYVVVTGVEQREYFAVLFEAIRVLFPETAHKVLKHIATGFLTLTTGKMSSRLGNVLTGESLIEDLTESAKARAEESRADDAALLGQQIAVAALKFEILKQGTGKNIVFDKEKSLSLEGDSGPYLQYTFARAFSLISKAKDAGIDDTVKFDIEFQAFGKALRLGRLLCRFPEIVSRATSELEPHLVTTFLVQVAAEFNSWYAMERIISDEKNGDVPSYLLVVTEAAARTLENGLWLLGIPAPEKM